MAQYDLTAKLHAMFFALGQAFYDWQSVERALFSVYEAQFRDVPQPLLAITFYRLTAFKEKLSLVDQSLRTQLPQKDYQRWVPIRKTANHCNQGHRNAFAHYEIRPEAGEPQMLPAALDGARYAGGEPLSSYTVDQIWQAIREFQAVANQLTDYAESIHWSPTVQATRAARLRQGPQPTRETLPNTKNDE